MFYFHFTHITQSNIEHDTDEIPDEIPDKAVPPAGSVILWQTNHQPPAGSIILWQTNHFQF